MCPSSIIFPPLLHSVKYISPSPKVATLELGFIASPNAFRWDLYLHFFTSLGYPLCCRRLGWLAPRSLNPVGRWVQGTPPELYGVEGDEYLLAWPEKLL